MTEHADVDPEAESAAGLSSVEDHGGPITTPATWRVGAGIILVGGLALGVIAPGGAIDVWIAVGLPVALAVGVIPILRASRRPPIESGALEAVASRPLPTVLVLIGGRDEAGVIPNLMADLGAQDHRDPDGSPRFRVTVVDDRSTDGTGVVTKASAAQHGLEAVTSVLRREGSGLADGKGAALASAHAERSEMDVVAVLDADARIGPGYLRRVAQYVAAGVPALTARRRTLEPERSVLAMVQADEQTQDGELQSGRYASGGCSEFRGNGFAIRRDLLAAVGGVPGASLTEDLELSARLAAGQGITVAWAMDLEVWEEAVPNWPSLWRQRLRWSEGGLRRLFGLGPSVLRSAHLSLRARWDFAAYGAQLAAPPIIVGALVGGLVFGRPLLPVGLVASYLVAGGVLAFDALRWEVGPDGSGVPTPQRLARTIRVALFSLLWLAAINGALWRLLARNGAVRYDKTARAAASSGGPSDGSKVAGSSKA
ncbi:MAG: glycosyltransferase family 2 protein [Chloroflexi bacterium]|nr:glycosyltransferase family 2 protein [Chloroflexota bacterium]